MASIIDVAKVIAATRAPTIDQGFKAYGATLITTAAPYDPRTGTGSVLDSAMYMRRPGVDFLRPWVAVPNGAAFQWPLGVEGFSLTTDPVLGKHTFIGDNKVVLDVLHTGTEQITLSGSFPGDSSPAVSQALRQVVRAVSKAGKILFIPELMTHAQRVQVSHSEITRDPSGRTRDVNYSIDFQITGLAGKVAGPQFTVEPAQSTANNFGTTGRFVSTDGKHNTLQKVALWKYGQSSQWQQIYDLNQVYFLNHSIPLPQAPSYRLPPGVALYY